MSETIIINPYNPYNQLVPKHVIEKLLNRKINNLSIYQNAFVHKSYCIKTKDEKTNAQDNTIKVLAERPENCLPLQPESNERLEFLGDSILGAVVTTYLYNRFNEDEGFCTKLKTKLVNSDTLASFTRYFKLEKYLIISRHVEDRCNGRHNPRILEDLFESLIGAIFLDFSKVEIKTKPSIGNFYGLGYHIAEKFIINLLEKTIDFTSLIKNDYNYKDILLRFYQQKFSITPKYIEIKVEGPAHQRIFTMSVLDNNNEIVGTGKERSKKKAEQLASKEALIFYDQLEESETEEDSSSESDSDSDFSDD